jgi:DNA modification methylase
MYNFPFVVIHYPEALYKLSFEVGKFPERVISWVYNSNTAKQHRDIAFFGVKPDMNKVKQPYKNPTDKRMKERIAKGITGCKLYDWWEINQVKNVSKNKGLINHPCVMPIEVMKRIIGILPDDYIIFDPFMGSGTTGIACKELNRDFIGSEIDESYFEIAVDRVNGITQKDKKLKEMGIQNIFDLL